MICSAYVRPHRVILQIKSKKTSSKDKKRYSNFRHISNYYLFSIIMKATGISKEKAETICTRNAFTSSGCAQNLGFATDIVSAEDFYKQYQLLCLLRKNKIVYNKNKYNNETPCS